MFKDNGLHETRYCENCLELQKKLQAKEQECEELKERVKTKCFDPKNKNNRCISYNRISQDYEIDLMRLNKYKQALEDIEKYCTYMNTFNECNKTNMGLKVDVVLDLINKAKENKQ